MTVELITGVLLIAVPIAFNLAFFELGRAFDYPDILRKEPDEILRRFAAGGAGPDPALAGAPGERAGDAAAVGPARGRRSARRRP